MKLITILFYLILSIYQYIFSQEATHDKKNIFKDNSLDSLELAIPESLVLDLISEIPPERESTIKNNSKKDKAEKDTDNTHSSHIKENRDYIQNQRDNFPDTSSRNNKDRTVYKSEKTNITADPDIIIVEDEDTTEFEKVNNYNSQKSRLDIFVDHSQGMNVPRFKILPKNLNYKGRPSYMFDFGIFFPFLDLFYGGISIKYLKLSLFLTDSYIIISRPQSISSKIDTKEYLKFMSIPFEVGMRLKFGRFTPYIFMDLEPAFLTTANQTSVKHSHFSFNINGPRKRVEEHYDLNVRNNRTTFQLFFGGGIGLEIGYNYGSLFTDIGCQYALLKTVKEKDYKSVPYRKSDGLIYFPISFGLRFYL